jgi:hypothetical protein
VYRVKSVQGVQGGIPGTAAGQAGGCHTSYRGVRKQDGRDTIGAGEQGWRVCPRHGSRAVHPVSAQGAGPLARHHQAAAAVERHGRTVEPITPTNDPQSVQQGEPGGRQDGPRVASSSTAQRHGTPDTQQ